MTLWSLGVDICNFTPPQYYRNLLDSTARVGSLIENYDSNWIRLGEHKLIDARMLFCSCIGEIDLAWRSHVFFSPRNDLLAKRCLACRRIVVQ